MEGLLTNLDGGMAAFAAPLARALIWGTLTGIISMVVYVLVAPQDTLKAIKAEQRANKAVLKAYDGEFDGMMALIKKDLGCNLRMVGHSLLPFVLSVAPAFGIMFGLEAAYMGVALPGVGPEWSATFEFWYIVAAIVSSLAIKIGFKIT